MKPKYKIDDVLYSRYDSAKITIKHISYNKYKDTWDYVVIYENLDTQSRYVDSYTEELIREQFKMLNPKVITLRAYYQWQALSLDKRKRILAFIDDLIEGARRARIKLLSRSYLIDQVSYMFLISEDVAYVALYIWKKLRRSMKKNEAVSYQELVDDVIDLMLYGYSDIDIKDMFGAVYELSPGYVDVLLRSARSVFKRAVSNNPPDDGGEIYDRVLAIEARKGKKSLWANEDFRHDFTSKASIYGLSDGSLLIRSKEGKRLWKRFKGYEKGIDYQ